MSVFLLSFCQIRLYVSRGHINFPKYLLNIDISGDLLYNKNRAYLKTVGGQSCSRKGVNIMNNYISWSELFQFGMFLTGLATFLYTVFSNKRK